MRRATELAALDRADRAVGVAAAVQPHVVADDGDLGVGLREDERRLDLPFAERAGRRRFGLPGRRDRAVGVRAADQQQAGRRDHAGRVGAAFGQLEVRLHPADQFPGLGIDRLERAGLRVRVQRRRSCRSGRRPHHDHRGRRCCPRRTRRWRPSAGPGASGPRSTCRSCRCRRSSRRYVVSTARLAVRSADVQQGRADLDDRAAGPAGRQAQFLRRGLPRDDRAGRRRARQGLVGRRAQVDRGPDQDAEVDGAPDREVVRAVGQVAQHEDDDQQPGEGLSGRPGPAVSVEQAEEDPLAAVRTILR